MEGSPATNPCCCSSFRCLIGHRHGNKVEAHYPQRRRPDARIIVMTAAADAQVWAKEVQADVCVAKPFEMDVLLDTVGRVATRQA